MKRQCAAADERRLDAVLRPLIPIVDVHVRAADAPVDDLDEDLTCFELRFVALSE